MDDEFGRTVRELLPDKFERIDEVIKDKMTHEPGMTKANIPGFVWDVIGSKTTDAVRGVLDCDVFGLLARAWAKARELQECANESKRPTSKKVTAFLGDHKLVTNVHPIVEVSLIGFGPTKLRFTLAIAAEFHSAELQIINGQIVAIGAGDCEVSVQLKFEDVNLHTVKSSNLKLSKPMTLTPPVQIA